MPDSSITKHALANALKVLMKEMPFEKIRISHICEKCNMNRQSFYYHFQDKYELMNWIFDVELNRFICLNESNQSMEEITFLMRILYDNRDFYRNALSVQGQNSLIEHIREIALPILKEIFLNAAKAEDDDYYCAFILDALLSAVMRWISDENASPPEVFVPRFFSSILSTAKYILIKYEQDVSVAQSRHLNAFVSISDNTYQSV